MEELIGNIKERIESLKSQNLQTAKIILRDVNNKNCTSNCQNLLCNQAIISELEFILEEINKV